MTENSEMPTTMHRNKLAHEAQSANGTFDEAVDIFSLSCTLQ